MKLKQLHIRNIASIERGDIDFENGLCDPLTGEPSGLFLISGDTGAGKTVILDCISMALYRQTPRQNSVANKKQNDFRTSEGEMLGVGAIEQYTRIGISAKDDCYSELIFEGNDGVEYCARLELGMMRRNGAPKGQLQHRASKWKVKVGREDWKTGVKEVETTIRKAVGLSFEQFGRMAMLAQGQFAAFLTGEKKEREEILEQLTSTGHFSKYGEAIKNIFKRVSDSANAVQTEHDNIARRRISDDDRDARMREKSLIENEMEKLRAERERLESQRRDIQAVATTDAEIAERTALLERLRGEAADETHTEMKRLVEGFDATTAQRADLAERRRLQTARQKEVESIPSLHDEYMLLLADLGARVKLERENGEKMEREMEWLKDREDKKGIIGRADELIVHLKNLAANRKFITESIGNISKEEKLLPELQRNLASCEEKKVVAERNVEANRQSNDSLGEQLKNLEQTRLTTRLADLQKRIGRFDQLNDRLDRLAECQKIETEMRGRIAQKEGELVKLRKAAAEAAEVADRRREEVEKAIRLHDLLEKGVDEAIVSLRRNLIESGADTCPLCGSHLEHLNDAEEAVRRAIVPAGESLARARKESAEAEKILEDARGKAAALDGEILTERTHLESNAREMSGLLGKLRAECGELQIAAGEEIAGISNAAEIGALIGTRVAEAREMAEKSVAETRGKLDEADRLGKEIRELSAERKKLDKVLKQCESDLRDSQKNSDACQERISNLKRQVAEREIADQEISSAMPEGFAALYPDWEMESLKVADLLRREAAEYEAHMKSFEQSSREGERLLALVGSLEGFSRDIRAIRSEWSEIPEARMLDEKDPSARWRRLHDSVARNDSEIKRCDAEIALRERSLDEYYAASGMDEGYLVMLSEGERRVGDARKALADLATKIASTEAALADSRRRGMEAIGRLGVEDRSAIPAIELTESAIAGNEKMRDELNVRKGVIEHELAQADADESEYRKVAQALADAKALRDKWDRINQYFGGARFRTLVQSYILRPLLNNANIYLSQITDQYRLTCSDDNEQLSILVLDRYNKDQVRSVTVLSGGERFMISLSLSLALSSLNRQDMNVDILFIDEGFGTLDEKVLDSVMATLERLQEIAGQSGRRVGVISHREELDERIPVKIRVRRHGEGRSEIEVG